MSTWDTVAYYKRKAKLLSDQVKALQCALFHMCDADGCERLIPESIYNEKLKKAYENGVWHGRQRERRYAEMNKELNRNAKG